jgi:HAMP domain-containing protein
MPTPRAKYEIAAEDKSGPAWAQTINRAQKSVGQIKSLVGTAFTALSIGALTSQISKAVEFGDEIGKIKAKANLTAEATQELVYAFGQFDIETASVSAALKKMNVTISEFASGGTEATEVFRALGVPLQALQGLKSDERLELIADAISHLAKEEDRARALTSIFGKAGFDLAPAFENGAAGIKSARDEIRNMGRVLDEEQIQKLGDADDAIKRLKQSWGAFAAELTSNVAPALTGVIDTLSGGHTAAASFQDRLTELERLKENRSTFGEINSDDTNAELDRRISSLERQILGSAGHGARQPGKSGGAAPGFDTTSSIPFTPARGINRNDRLFQEFDENIKYLEELEKKSDEVKDLFAELNRDTSDEMNQRVDKEVDQDIDLYKARTKAAEESVSELSVFAEEAARNMQDSFAQFLFDPFDKGLKGMVKGFIDSIRHMLAEAASAKLFESLFGGTGGGGGYLGTILGAFGGGKAAGGPLQSGKWYVAGEHGPEPIWGGGAGSFAAGYGGGGVTVNAPFSVDMRGGTRDGVEALAKVLPRMKQQWQDETIAKVIDGLKRRKYRT